MWLAVIGVINSAIAVFYYLRVTVAMYMRDPEREFQPLTLSPFIFVAIVISIIGTIQLGIFPAKVLEIVRQSVLILR